MPKTQSVGERMLSLQGVAAGVGFAMLALASVLLFAGDSDTALFRAADPQQEPVADGSSKAPALPSPGAASAPPMGDVHGTVTRTVSLSEAETVVDLGPLALGGLVVLRLDIVNDRAEATPPLAVAVECTCEASTFMVPALAPGGRSSLELSQIMTVPGEVQSTVRLEGPDGLAVSTVVLRAKLTGERFLLTPVRYLGAVSDAGTVMAEVIVDIGDGADGAREHVPELPENLTVAGELEGTLFPSDAAGHGSALAYVGHLRAQPLHFGALRGEYQLRLRDGRTQRGWLLADAWPPELRGGNEPRTRVHLAPRKRSEDLVRVPGFAFTSFEWIDATGGSEQVAVDLTTPSEVRFSLLDSAQVHGSTARLRVRAEQGDVFLVISVGADPDGD